MIVVSSEDKKTRQLTREL